MVSDVALLTYFVFFTSSSDAALYTPTFSSEDVVAGFAAAVVPALFFLNDTGVQSWQSGTLGSFSANLDITLERYSAG
jgi:hypothetical protein